MARTPRHLARETWHCPRRYFHAAAWTVLIVVACRLAVAIERPIVPSRDVEDVAPPVALIDRHIKAYWEAHQLT
ncbi:MAG: hypothetical protein WD845_18380, partial [Pirellulales bacterium]